MLVNKFVSLADTTLLQHKSIAAVIILRRGYGIEAATTSLTQNAGANLFSARLQM